MKVLCISVANIFQRKENSTSEILCFKISENFGGKEKELEIFVFF